MIRLWSLPLVLVVLLLLLMSLPHDAEAEPRHDPEKEKKETSEAQCSEAEWPTDQQQQQPLRRTCAYRNVCFDSNQKFLFFAEDPASVDASQLEVVAGTYAVHPKVSWEVRPLREAPWEGDGAHSSSSRCWYSSERVFVHYSPSSMYWHWLVDDTLGLYHLLEFHDQFGPRPARDFVVATLNRPPHLRLLREIFGNVVEMNDLPRQQDGGMVCFRNLYAGEQGYNYGGPGLAHIQTSDLLRYRDFFYSTLLGAVPDFGVRGSLDAPVTVTLIRRESLRTIVNDEELMARLREGLPSEVSVNGVYLEKLSFREQLDVFRTTTILVGVHGSGLSNILFLSPGAAALEVFPYGISRPSYRLLAGRLDVHYAHWTNEERSKAIFHEHYLASMSSEQRAKVMGDPTSVTSSWTANLYWVNQDTVVDADAIVTRLATELLPRYQGRRTDGRRRAEGMIQSKLKVDL